MSKNTHLGIVDGKHGLPCGVEHGHEADTCHGPRSLLGRVFVELHMDVCLTVGNVCVMCYLDALGQPCGPGAVVEAARSFVQICRLYPVNLLDFCAGQQV